ncbi:RING domain-containing protein [Cryptosporidium ubiquitum]|uniref:RING domain-containing protein n=1 Tax=Cryptosporidium ubiquitum TaxID=857276 RepID=A0A1J4MPH7_9CRYT|nr:RING domain-containing protein [Cryptosporidium ubiquitum]OII74773.1 RING domain-containing protein [Cryptosporidium ubiquitum]
MNFSRNKKGSIDNSKYTYEPGDLETKVTENGLDVSFKRRVVSDLLICPICEGFFRGATTIRECLHTFCKTCIIKHIESKGSECPKCGQDIGIYPLQGLVFDRTIQNITDKIFPEFKEKERKLYSEFLEKYGDEAEINDEKDLMSLTKPIASQLSEIKLKPVDFTEQFYKELLLPELENNESQDSKKQTILESLSMKIKLESINSEIFELEKPFLMVPPQITIFHLQNYIMHKSNEKFDRIPFIFLKGGQILPRNHSLEFVCRSRRIPLNNLLTLQFGIQNN